MSMEFSVRIYSFLSYIYLIIPVIPLVLFHFYSWVYNELQTWKISGPPSQQNRNTISTSEHCSIVFMQSPIIFQCFFSATNTTQPASSTRILAIIGNIRRPEVASPWTELIISEAASTIFSRKGRIDEGTPMGELSIQWGQALCWMHSGRKSSHVACTVVLLRGLEYSVSIMPLLSPIAGHMFSWDILFGWRRCPEVCIYSLKRSASSSSVDIMSSSNIVGLSKTIVSCLELRQLASYLIRTNKLYRIRDFKTSIISSFPGTISDGELEPSEYVYGRCQPILRAIMIARSINSQIIPWLGSTISWMQRSITATKASLLCLVIIEGANSFDHSRQHRATISQLGWFQLNACADIAHKMRTWKRCRGSICPNCIFCWYFWAFIDGNQ